MIEREEIIRESWIAYKDLCLAQSRMEVNCRTDIISIEPVVNAICEAKEKIENFINSHATL